MINKGDIILMSGKQAHAWACIVRMQSAMLTDRFIKVRKKMICMYFCGFVFCRVW